MFITVFTIENFCHYKVEVLVFFLIETNCVLLQVVVVAGGIIVKGSWDYDRATQRINHHPNVQCLHTKSFLYRE